LTLAAIFVTCDVTSGYRRVTLKSLPAPKGLLATITLHSTNTRNTDLEKNESKGQRYVEWEDT